METITVPIWNGWLPLALATLFITLTTRLAVVLLFYVGKPLPPSSIKRHLTTVIVLGSGGHTAEMLNLVAVLNKDRFCPRWYIAAATDNMSLARAKVAEESGMGQAEGSMLQGSKYMQIYRSREVGQSYLTSIGTTLVAMVHALWLIFKIRPDVFERSFACLGIMELYYVADIVQWPRYLHPPLHSWILFEGFWC